MADKLKGITLEIGGDTTGLNKALSGVNKQSRDLQSELTQVNKLLKFDPTNTELISQKQKLLAESIEITQKKLDTLKTAEKQVQEQFKNGEVSEEQYRALQREIAATSSKLDSLKDDAKSTGTALSAAFKDAGEKVGEFGEKAENLGKKLAPVSTATAGIATGLIAAGISAGAAADDINTLATQTGLSTEAIQKFKYAADIIDVDLDTLTKSMAKLTKNMSTAQKGTGDAATAFSALGVAITDDVTGELLNNQDVFDNVIDALADVENETQRDAYAMAIFGKSAQDLNPLILGGSDALKQLGQEAEDAGLILSQDTLDSANEFNDAVDKIKATATGTFAKVGSEIAKSLIPYIEKLLSKVEDLSKWFGSLNGETIKTILKIALLVAGIAPALIVIGKLSTGVKAVSTALSFLAANPVALAIAAVAALTLGITALVLKSNEESEGTKAQRLEHEKITEAIKSENQSWDDLKASQEEKKESDLTEISNTQALWAELQTLADENGNVTDANKNRATFIMGELNTALGTELTMTQNQIQGYKDSIKYIDELIDKKKAQIILDSQEPLYKKATLNLNAKNTEQAELALAIAKEEAEIKSLENAKAYADTQKGKKAIQAKKEQLEADKTLYTENEKIINDYYSSISTYESNSAAISSNNYEKIQSIIQNYGTTIKTASTATDAELKQQVATTALTYAELQKKVENGVEGVTQEMVDEAKTAYDNALTEWQNAGNAIPEGLKAGIDETAGDVLVTTGNFISDIKEWFTGVKGFDIHSPSRYMQWVGESMMEGLLIGLQSPFAGIESVIDGIISTIKMPFNAAIGFVNMLVDSINFLIGGINKISLELPDWDILGDLAGMSFGFDIPTIPKIPYLAKGGILSNGQAIIAEAGPELIQMLNGRTIVTPLSSSSQNTPVNGGASINFSQTINSPKALSRHEIYRNTKNGLKLATMGVRRR